MFEWLDARSMHTHTHKPNSSICVCPIFDVFFRCCFLFAWISILSCPNAYTQRHTREYIAFFYKNTSLHRSLFFRWHYIFSLLFFVCYCCYYCFVSEQTFISVLLILFLFLIYIFCLCCSWVGEYGCVCVFIFHINIHYSVVLARQHHFS